MDYKSVSRAKWKKQHYQAYVTDLEARQTDRDKEVESHLRAHIDRERNQTALIEQMKEEHKSELQQVRESLTGAVKKLRDDRDSSSKCYKNRRSVRGLLAAALLPCLRQSSRSLVEP